MDYIDFNNDHAPLGYLITFRSYGTWLHGDARGSVDRFHRGYGTPRLPLNSARRTYEEDLLKQRAVILDSRQRAAIESGVRETCTIRKWSVWALNVRTNHVHAVVSANRKRAVATGFLHMRISLENRRPVATARGSVTQALTSNHARR